MKEVTEQISCHAIYTHKKGVTGFPSKNNKLANYQQPITM